MYSAVRKIKKCVLESKNKIIKLDDNKETISKFKHTDSRTRRQNRRLKDVRTKEIRKLKIAYMKMIKKT